MCYVVETNPKSLVCQEMEKGIGSLITLKYKYEAIRNLILRHVRRTLGDNLCPL